jgi:hypothetical protein
LVDGLVGARADQLRGPVGGQGEQRHAGVGRLQHRGVQVRRGRAGGRADRHRPAGPQREPEGQEPGGALVDPHVQAQPAGRVGRVESERQRSIARPRAEHSVGDPAAHQLVDDHLGLRRRRVHRPQPTET